MTPSPTVSLPETAHRRPDSPPKTSSRRKRARLGELIRLSRGIQREINEGEVGREEEVLVEKEGREAGFLLGRTRRNKVAVFPGEGAELGSYQTLQLTRTTGATFVGSRVHFPAVSESK